MFCCGSTSQPILVVWNRNTIESEEYSASQRRLRRIWAAIEPWPATTADGRTVPFIGRDTGPAQGFVVSLCIAASRSGQGRATQPIRARLPCTKIRRRLARRSRTVIAQVKKHDPVTGRI